jgi:hypothetical protein
MTRWTTLRNSLDIFLVWLGAAVGFFCRTFVVPRNVRVPHDLHGWGRFAISFFMVAGGLMLQEHFRSKNRDGRIKNFWRRLFIAFLLGLGASIGE